MTNYLLKRLGALLPTVAVPMVLLFVMLRLAPGDPAAAIAGDAATSEEIAEVRTRLGLDASLWDQFLTWLGRVVRLDFGNSLFADQAVSGLVAEHALVTVQLTVLALAVAVLIGPALGIAAGTRRHGLLDRVLVFGSSVGIALPSFWLAVLLIAVFGVVWQVFPVAGYVSFAEDPLLFLHHLALPAISLGLLEAATLFRYSRAGVLDSLHQPFVTTARSMGLPERTVIRKYVFRAAVVPMVTVVGLTTGSLMGGAVVTESIFSIPGLGQLLLTAVQRRDYPVIEGCIFFIAVVYVLLNLVIDLLYSLLDPRIRY
ncbi:ABC transporter permease [Lentzea sp. BCCO 10_0061]|uniref:ABC transporter permease n=1 Tax=Lentzea sokolovensis TaxID=3095429 RepID=A0ABU4V6B2_9PSEU|nr:ABC transporter permease [Lentzea sp. BCCO 10_0061]MDX8147337.1 ABC transporter permease [Lentzea sp. BCCO 10_0061]